ncbi:MAG: sodium:proton antiporter [Verrucomicrobiota bacterium]|jgi:Na+/H+ antiporter NhaD/arsenite permease-like protein
MAAPSPIFILPFALLLATMALAPVLAPHWWGRHYPKVALGLGLTTAAAYFFLLDDAASLEHAAHEYVSFIALVGSLYVIAGGIRITAPAGATPLANVLFLLAGAVAANVLGTTGAAMLLIRPWIHMNRARISGYHLAFFIFLVANVGGCLTPIGDPPLFLGYLQGVPFWWVAKKCWPMWAVGTGLLLAMFFVLDRIAFARAEKDRPPAGAGTWGIEGLPNLLFLAVVLGALFLTRPPFLRELLMLGAAAGSHCTTRKFILAANEFDFHPITEVAILFAGIFVTMIPALAWLDHGAAGLAGPRPAPAFFFWGAGGLSAVLDNAPTYLGFLSTLFGITGVREIPQLLDQNAAQVVAISVGSVFFGAATYIGNGPNFMVKAIAAQRGVPVPSFLAFIAKFSLPFLLPVLIITFVLFFRG